MNECNNFWLHSQLLHSFQANIFVVVLRFFCGRFLFVSCALHIFNLYIVIIEVPFTHTSGLIAIVWHIYNSSI